MVIGSPFDIILRNYTNNNIRVVQRSGRKAHLSFLPPVGMNTNYGRKLCEVSGDSIGYIDLAPRRLERLLLEGNMCRTCIKYYVGTSAVVDKDGEWFELV